MRNSAKWYRAICKANSKRRGEKRRFSPKKSATMKALWNDPDYRKQLTKGRSEEAKARWADPTFKKKFAKTKKSRSEKMKLWWKQHHKEMCKKRKQQAKKRDYSAWMKKNWANPEFHAKMCKIRKTQSKGNQLRHPNASFYRTMYEGINGKFWMRSSWEVAYAKWLDHYGIRWTYESKKFCIGNGRYYTPDFYLVDQKEYVELKGWMTKKDEKKIEKFRELYPELKLYVFFGKQQLAKVLEFKKAAA